MPKRQKILSWLLRGMAVAIFLFLAGISCIYVFLQRDPDKLLSEYLTPLSEKTGLKFDIGSVDVTLLPLPAFAISDVAIHGDGLTFRAAWAQARPTLASIFHGELFPGFISVFRPRLEYDSDLQLDSLQSIVNDLKKRFGGSGGATSDLPSSLVLELARCDVRVADREGRAIQLANLDANLRLHADDAISGHARFSALRFISNSESIANLENFSVSGRASIHNFFIDSASRLQAEGTANLRGISREIGFKADFGGGKNGWHSQLSIRGALDLDHDSIPFDLQGQVAGKISTGEMRFKGVEWQLGADSGSIDLSLSLPAKPADFVLQGSLRANRLSLVQWLGFARNLAPGLQLALDNIINARMNFRLDAKSLSATDIAASCCGAVFTGSGGVASWQTPVVALELESPLVSLGLGLPESVGKNPDAPYFAHAPLTPMPGTPLQPGEIGIGYDIRLGAKTLRYGPLGIQDAKLRIHPGKLDKSGLEDVLLDAGGAFYGGSLTGACILGADKSLPIHITAKARKVNGAPLARDMPSLPFRKGMWEGNATVTSRGKQLAAFLANLRGNISATGINATLAATGDKMSFNQLEAAVRLRGGAWDGKYLTMDGQWSGGIKDESLNGQSELNGKIQFGADGMAFRLLPGTISASGQILPANASVKISGKFSGSSSKNIFELDSGKLECLGIVIHGDGKLDGARELIQAKIRTEIKNPGALLAKAGFKNAQIPSALAPLKINAELSGWQNAFRLSQLQAGLGKLKLTGSLGVDLKNKKPAVAADLELDKLALDEFTANTGSSQTKSPWDFHFLTTFNASGKIQITHLAGWNATFRKVHIPFNLEDGQILANDISAIFYGARMTGSFSGDFRKGLVFDSIIRAPNFDLGAAASEQKIASRLTGRASMEMRLRASLAGRDKLAPALNGKWSFTVKDGSWQGVTNGKPGTVTRFNVAEAFGTVTSGIVKSDNFHLAGPELSVTGKGALNLPAQTIDCDFYVSMKGLPDFPLRLYGPLKDMKTSIGAGKLILNAVGDVTGGFINAVGGLLKGAWGIFNR